MKPDALIEAYVADVIRHLPRRQRNDVGFELRSLLTEELGGRAAAAGREPDSAMVLDLLADFGRPVEVADRYAPAGFTIIRPADAPRFTWIALGGVAIQWLITLFVTFSRPLGAEPGSDWLGRLGTWWLSWGLGSFWWPGLLVSVSILAAALGGRREDAAEWTARRAAILDRDRIRRPLLVLAIAAALVGVGVLSALPELATVLPGLPRPLLEAFTLDASFLADRAVWVLPMWAVSLAICIAVLATGRWTRVTRVLALVADAAWIALLAWWISAGPIFASAPTDSATKGCLILVIALIGLDLVLTARRLSRRRLPSPI